MAGFTLVEMAIVILIMGILLVPILEAYSHYIKEKRIEDTRENIAAVTSGISGFQDVQARLPCPADATLAPGAANFGKEFDVNCNPAAIGLTAAGMCTAGNGICLVAGQRNLGGAAGATDANELVLIGAVPIVSMRDQGVSERTAVANDAWGRKLTYAVTASLTQRRLPTLPMSERSGSKMNLETIQPELMGMDTWLLFHMGKMEKAVLTKLGE
jgi:prepilin-type N-terminal cleavage/methylation domain-containing protein